MNVWAIVPVKPLNRAKSRLAEVLPPDDREQLAAGLLERTIRLLQPMPEIHGVLVISRDTKALALVRDLGAHTVQESGNPELNTALYRATNVLWMQGADAALVVPADLPLLSVDDIRSVLGLARYQQTVVLAPDRREEGTNLLLVRPPGLIPYAFGGPSFAEHQRLAREAGATLHVYRSERAGLDLDTPDDLLTYYELAALWNEPVVPHTRPEQWMLDSHRHLEK